MRAGRPSERRFAPPRTPDQLTDQVGPISSALKDPPNAPEVIFIESLDAQTAPRHVQALVAQRSAGREFVAELRARGLNVQALRAATYEEGLTAAQAQAPITHLLAMEPAAPQLTARMQTWAEQTGVQLSIVPNELWLTTRNEWQEFASGRKELRMEFWYRRVRKARGWLMEPSAVDEPLGAFGTLIRRIGAACQRGRWYRVRRTSSNRDCAEGDQRGARRIGGTLRRD